MSSNGTHAAVTRVGWIGPRPSWLEDEQLKGIVLVGDRSKADVIHAVVAAGDLARLDRDVPSTSALVVHLQNADRLQAAQARRLARARIILVDSPVEWASVKHRLPKADVRVLRAQVDLDWFAPEPQLMETKLRGRDLRRFRRFHRLAGPVVLFAGPYTRAGGMSRVLEAVFETRKSVPETRFAAIPDGPIDPAQLDAMERRALALGHHGIIEWTVGDNERSFWYACATVVCAPVLEAAPSAPPLYAAAAGRPFVTNDPVAAALGLRNDTGGYVVDTSDASTLSAAVAALVADADEAQRLGENGRSWAEQNLTEAARLVELGRLWHQANPDPPALVSTEPSDLGLAHAERAHA